MEDDKELVVIRMLSDLQEEYPNINNLKVKYILEQNLKDYLLVTNETSLMISDLPEKITYFLGVKKLDGLSEKSLEGYFYELKMFGKYVNKPVSQITVNDLRYYLTVIQKEKHYEDITINNKISILKSFFGTLHEEEIIPKNPSVRLKTLDVDVNNLREPLNGEELEKLRNACKDIREKCLVEVFFSTGCRLSEIVKLNKSDINWSEKSTIVNGKGNKNRTVFFSVKCKLYLQEYLNSRIDDNESLFVSEREPHDKLGKSGIEKIFKKIKNRTDIKTKISPHVLRHTRATQALSRGMDIVDISKLLGHSSVKTTEIYSKVDTSKLKYKYEQYLS